jgi:hypothetical protein
MTTDKTGKQAIAITDEQRAALTELAARFKPPPSNFLSPLAIASIIKSEWGRYLGLCQCEGTVTNVGRERRSLVKQIAKFTGHKLTIEDARQVYGELDPVLVDLFTADLERLQQPTPRKKRDAISPD